MRYVIIGNGIAGISAVEAIRELDREGEIIVIGDETVTPYSRPMICQVLEGSQPHEKLPIRSADFYERLNVTSILGKRIQHLDVGDKRVGFENGQWVDFDRLLIASGADPRPVEAKGLTLKNIFYMRTEKHARQQVEALSDARQALVLGGGLVGFKAAYGLLRRGLKVTMLITSGYPLSLQVDEPAGKLILDQLLQHGLDVRVGVSVTAFEGNGKVTAAHTDSGETLPCDMVIIGKGVLPALDFVPRERIEVDLGIVVDRHLQSSATDIFAAGDAAETVDIARQRPWVNAIWPEAAAQGRVAGFNMAGRPVACSGSLSRNVMRIFDLDLMTVGLANPYNPSDYQIVRSENKLNNTYRSLVFDQDCLVGAVLINQIEQGGILRGLIETRQPLTVPPEVLMAPEFNFARLCH
jgi:NAD(P)H-nitrite reductase large subunit